MISALVHDAEASRSQREALPETALVLSGGGAYGFFHLGVAKALLHANLLPRVIAGASMGAMIGAGLAARTDDELRRAFADPSWLERTGLVRRGWRELLRRRSFFSNERMLLAIRHNVGAATFGEAQARTGRALAIAVTSARRGHAVRLLTSYQTPHLPLAEAALASSALPLLFRPVELDGEPYLDGSFGGDVPVELLEDALGAGHFVVSQANPYALPFVRLPQTRIGRFSRRIAHQSSLRINGIARAALRRTPAGSPFELAHALLSQTYRGHVTITPRLDPRLVARMLKNPTIDDLLRCIEAGEAATAPHLPALAARARLRASPPSSPR